MAASTEDKRSIDEFAELEIALTRSTDQDSQQEDLPLWRAIRKYPKVVGYSLGLSSAILLWGFDTSIVGNVSAVPAFQRDFGRQMGNRYIIPSLWMGLWNACTPIGLIIGSMLAGWLQDRYGRRLTLVLGTLLSAVGVAIVFVSDMVDGLDERRGTFLIGKWFQGLAIGGVLCTVQTYMSEVLPLSLRGSVLAFFPVFTLLGQLAGAVVLFTSLDIEGSRSYKTCFAAQWPFSAVPMIMGLIVPESPTYLIRKGKMEKALKAQKRLDSKGANSQATINQLCVILDREQRKGNHTTYGECFKSTDRRRTLIVMFAACIPFLFGLTLLSDASYFMQIVGMSAHNAVLFLQLGIGLGLVANLVSMWVLSRVGRRRIILITMSITSVLWLGMGIAGCFRGYIMIWWTAVTMMVIVIVIGVGAWPASYAVGSETSALRLRGKAQGLGWSFSGFWNAIFGLCVPYIYNIDAGNLRAKTGFVFAGLCAATCAIVWLYVPEMKGRTIMEIDMMFEAQVKTRDFGRWRREVEQERSGLQDKRNVTR